MNQWLEAATQLARQSGDAEAKQLATFLQERAVLGLPRAYNDLAYVPRADVNAAQAVYIVPMISIDYLTLPTDDYWRDFASPSSSVGRSVLAEFYVPTHAIYLPGEWPGAEIQSALLLLHEGQHAYDHMVRGAHMPKPFWRRERNAQLMELRILKTLGGEEFATYLDRLIPEVERQQDTAASIFAFTLPHQLRDDVLLDRILWPAATMPEQRDRQVDIERSAVAHYFERRYGSQGVRTYYGRYVRENYIANAHPQHLAGLE